MKGDVDNHLTSKEEKILDISFTSIQKTYYKAIYENNTSFLFKDSKPGNASSLMNVMMDIRECWNILSLICGAEERNLADAGASVPHKS